MSRVRMIVEISVHDYDGVVEFLSRAVRHIEEHLLGTLAWDCFIDQATGHTVWYEEFADERALLEYEKSMTDHGFRREIGEYANLERVTVLGPVSDTGLLAMLQQMGAVHVDHTLGVTR